MIPLGVLAARRPDASGGPVVLASDSFNRANGNLDGSSTDSAFGGTAHTWVNNASHAIESNYLRATSSLVRYSGIDVGTGDVAVTVSVLVLSGGAVCARMLSHDTRTGRYAAEVASDGSVSLTVEYGGSTTLGSVSPGALVAGDALTLRCLGTSISVEINGVSVISVIDGTLPSSREWVGLQSSALAWRVDDFLVTEP